MNKKLLVFLFSVLTGITVVGQTPMEGNSDLLKPQSIVEPFLFSVSTLTKEDMPWSLNYSGSYGERVSNDMAYNGIGQQIALKGFLGNGLTLYANASFGFSANEKTCSSQQIEVIRDFTGNKTQRGLRIGFGLGGRRDYSDVASILGRATLSYNVPRWKIGSNLLFEKALDNNRDAVDVITSVGCHYQLLNSLYVGFEALGEDLEGFWEKEEAEGGAKVLVGPSVNLLPNNSRFSFSFSGGPVLYATKSDLSNPNAIRDLPYESGLAVRAMVLFNLSK